MSIIRLAAIGALALALLTAMAAQADDVAPQATTGVLSVSPQTGNTTTPDVRLTAAAPCPAGTTNFYATIVGGGFPEGSNALGNNALSQVAAPVSALLGATWADIASSQGAPLPLSGLATVTLLCQDAGGIDVAGFAARVVFTPTTGTASTYADCTSTVVDCPSQPTPTLPPVTPLPPPPNQESFIIDVPDPGSDGIFAISVPAGGGDIAFRLAGSHVGRDGVYGVWVADLGPVVVTDDRLGRAPWAVTGQFGPFVGDRGSFAASYVGWSPDIVSEGMGAEPGPGVAPGRPGGGDGLGVAQLLASARLGHGGDAGATAVLGGKVRMNLPGTSVAAGRYRGTLTLTLMS